MNSGLLSAAKRTGDLSPSISVIDLTPPKPIAFTLAPMFTFCRSSGFSLLLPRSSQYTVPENSGSGPLSGAPNDSLVDVDGEGPGETTVSPPFVIIALIILSLTPAPLSTIKSTELVEYFDGCAWITVIITSSPSPAFTILMMESFVSAVCAMQSAAANQAAKETSMHLTIIM